jgi:hypothetical protein
MSSSFSPFFMGAAFHTQGKLYHPSYTADTHTGPDNDNLSIFLRRQCRGLKFWVPFLGTFFSLLEYSPAANIFRRGDYSFIALRTPGLSYSSPDTPAAP